MDTSVATPKVDEETLKRIKNLAYVGNALYSTMSSVSFDTNFFLAKEALVKFKEGIEKLELDTESREGMNSLIRFLEKELERNEARNRG